MRSTRLSNTAEVKVSDRAVVGPQPDQTPATGGTNPGGGGGPPTGPAGGFLDGTYPNPGQNVAYSPTFADINLTGGSRTVGFLTRVPIGYPAGGAIQIRFDLGSFDDIGLVVAASFSPAGSTGLVGGRFQELVLRNLSGAPLALTWNPSWVVAGPPLPTSLATAEAIRVFLSVGSGAAETDIAASWIPTVNAPPPITTYLPTTGDLNARLRKAISGTITGAGDMVWTRAPVFSIDDEGAIPNDSSGPTASNNVAAFAAAFNRGATSGRPFTVYVPDGDWYFDDQINLISAVEVMRLNVRGNGRHASRIIMTTANKIALNVDLSNGNSTTCKSHCEVNDLGFSVLGIDALAAVKISYGSGGINPRVNQGSSIRNIFVDGEDSASEVNGYINGVILENVWGATFSDLHLCGGQGWDDNTSAVGAGGNGVGSGRAIAVYGGTNNLFCNIYTQTWSQVWGFLPFVSGGFPSGLAPQGVHISNFDNVNCIEMMHGYQTGGVGCDSITLSNWQCDNGNNIQTHRFAFIMEGGSFGMRLQVSNGLYLSRQGEGFVYLDGFGSCFFTNVQFSESLGLTADAIHLTGVSNSNCFSCCTFGNNPIFMDTLCGFNQINNTQGSAITNLGGFNVTSVNIF